MNRPCFYFNQPTPAGTVADLTDGMCSFKTSADGSCKCKRAHVLYCTNNFCVTRKIHITHTFANCSCPSGPNHAEYLKKKAGVPVVVPVDVCERLYLAINAELIQAKEAIPPSVAALSNLAGKIVGMLREAMTAAELENLLADDIELGRQMAEGIEVLEKSLMTAS